MIMMMIIMMMMMIRDDTSHFTEVEDASMEDWVGYIRTWSGLQNMIRYDDSDSSDDDIDDSDD